MTVKVEYHPGPATGASWVILPELQIVFVGDAVLRNQPPFLANADLPTWLDTLSLLGSPAFKGWQWSVVGADWWKRIVSGHKFIS